MQRYATFPVTLRLPAVRLQLSHNLTLHRVKQCSDDMRGNNFAAQVEVLSGKRRGGRDVGRSPQELPFSEDAKRVFEAALTVRVSNPETDPSHLASFIAIIIPHLRRPHIVLCLDRHACP